jgi:hypothetical protein
MTIPMFQCAECRHLHRWRRDGEFCDAFPSGNGIPRAITVGTFDHRQPYPGDHGIQWEPRVDTPADDSTADPRSALRRLLRLAALAAKEAV